MATADQVNIELDRPIAEVWDGVTDAARYPDWLIGAQEVDVPPTWPQAGATFEHRIGFGPIRMPGSTTVRAIEEPTCFAISAGMGLLGEAVVAFELESLGPRRTRISMREQPAEGVVGVLHRLLRPVMDRIIRARNAASLERLGAELSA
jgi:carbon monoxide dehydrogenase subunit G